MLSNQRASICPTVQTLIRVAYRNELNDCDLPADMSPEDRYAALRKKVKSLLSDPGGSWSDRFYTPERRRENGTKSYYEHPAVKEILDAFFWGPQGIATTDPDPFSSKFPLASLAYVVTAIKHCFDQIVKSEQDVKFSADLYGVPYHQLMNELECILSIRNTDSALRLHQYLEVLSRSSTVFRSPSRRSHHQRRNFVEEDLPSQPSTSAHQLTPHASPTMPTSSFGPALHSQPETSQSSSEGLNWGEGDPFNQWDYGDYDTGDYGTGSQIASEEQPEPEHYLT